MPEKQCKHEWVPRPLFDLFSAHHSRCTKCRKMKYMVMMECKDGKIRPRWKIAWK